MSKPTDSSSHTDYITLRGEELVTSSHANLEHQLQLKVASERFRQARKDQGLTQAKLGKRLGVSRALISKLENDLGEVSYASIEKVFEALGMRTMLKIEPVGDGPVLAKSNIRASKA